MHGRTEHGTPGLRPRWRGALWAALAIVLLLPAVAMRFTPEVRWTSADFAAAAVLLIALGAGIELVARHIAAGRRQWLAGGLVAIAVALIWAEGAVGIA